MNEIKRRQDTLESYDLKVEKAALLKAEYEQLEKEIEATDVEQLHEEIKELTEDAIKLGYIEVEKAEEPTEEQIETVDNAERAASVFTQSY